MKKMRKAERLALLCRLGGHRWCGGACLVCDLRRYPVGKMPLSMIRPLLRTCPNHFQYHDDCHECYDRTYRRA